VLPRDAELLAFEAGREDCREREVDEVEWQGGRVYLHLDARRDDPPRGQFVLSPRCRDAGHVSTGREDNPEASVRETPSARRRHR
jgi:hypothetical protein